jgi:hypothetical protein
MRDIALSYKRPGEHLKVSGVAACTIEGYCLKLRVPEGSET